MENVEPVTPLRSFTTEEVAAICEAGEVAGRSAGEILFRRGELGESMFLLEEGEIELRFVDGDPGKTLRAGDIFGELSFLTGRSRRTATARATTPCRLRILGEAAVDALFESQPRLLIRLLRRTCRYLLASEKRLIDSLKGKNRELEQTLDYLRRTREEVDYQELLANTDDLTGLYNRRCFDHQLTKFIERSAAGGSELALLLVDLDEFKQANDSLGHAGGDEVLRCVGRAITSCVRVSDLPCRFGGDEFAIVLLGIDAEHAHRRAKTLRRRVEEMSSGPELRVTASIGGTTLRAGETAAELFERADRQLYRAKHEGRNRVVWQA